MIDELRPRLWRWELAHPDWTPEEGGEEGWDEIVASYALADGGDFVLIDPLLPAPDADVKGFWTTLDRHIERYGPPAVLLTIFWHARSAREILARYERASVWAHEPAAQLVSERTPVTETFRVGDTLPGGIEAHDAGRAFEVVFWLTSHRAVAAGDVLLGDGPGSARVCPASWLGGGKTQAGVRAVLRPLLDLPVELVLLTHGDAIEDDAAGALGRALG
jgi:glyoxylase-like metal-dependent hydrolase (beta-lactamase superfamily II)